MNVKSGEIMSIFSGNIFEKLKKIYSIRTAIQDDDFVMIYKNNNSFFGVLQELKSAIRNYDESQHLHLVSTVSLYILTGSPEQDNGTLIENNRIMNYPIESPKINEFFAQLVESSFSLHIMIAFRKVYILTKELLGSEDDHFLFKLNDYMGIDMMELFELKKIKDFNDFRNLDKNKMKSILNILGVSKKITQSTLNTNLLMDSIQQEHDQNSARIQLRRALDERRRKREEQALLNQNVEDYSTTNNSNTNFEENEQNNNIDSSSLNNKEHSNKKKNKKNKKRKH